MKEGINKGDKVKWELYGETGIGIYIGKSEIGESCLNTNTGMVVNEDGAICYLIFCEDQKDERGCWNRGWKWRVKFACEENFKKYFPDYLNIVLPFSISNCYWVRKVEKI